nr:flagellar biosynthesis protein FlhB [Desulfobulbaceae bacterium]
MAEESSGQEKTEEPTSRRLQEARNKGDVAKSMEIPSATVLLAGLMTLYMLSGYFLNTLSAVTAFYLDNAHSINITPGNIPGIAKECMLNMSYLVGPVMIAVFIAALISNYAQIGFIFTGEKMKPDLKKIDPIKGLAKKFSLQALAELVKSLLKVGLIGYVAFSEAYSALPEFMPLMDQTTMQIMTFASITAFWIFLKCALVIALLAILDYAFQRWQFMEKMKMTKQEVKEEAKMTEGDPQVKGRIRSIQMQMARQRMMAEVPTADVVITNPTRLAIALRYTGTEMSAPLVVAKGAGAIAQRIREVAAENNVPMVEDKPLARALYKNVKVNHPIPENLFQAVAEVLAYVYGMRKKRAA